MKNTKILLLVGLCGASQCFAGTNQAVPVPSFMNHEQMQKWKSSRDAISEAGQKSDDAFFTGKPYSVEGRNYLYQYRSFDAETSRWTSADPSGFPDGTNNNIYAPHVTTQLDNNGLMTVNGGGFADGQTVSGEFPGLFNYAAYGGTSWATATGTGQDGTGTVNLSTHISGFTTFSSVHDMSKTPTITVSVLPNWGGLTYSSSGSFGGADGVVGTGISFTVTGEHTGSLTFHFYSAYALSATSISGIGASATGGSISFASASVTDGPVSLGDFTFVE